MRLRKILKIIDKNYKPAPNNTYADFGCSNGYITSIVKDRYNMKAFGFDRNKENLILAKNKYPDIQFSTVDLNETINNNKYSLITCLETLEHVGNLKIALDNLINANNGFLLITVPIEIGLIGLMKFIVKTMIYGYTLKELKAETKKYFLSLLFGERISKYRENRPGWGTHFGFDYRDIDDHLSFRNVNHKAFNRDITRFYIIKHQPQMYYR